MKEDTKPLFIFPPIDWWRQVLGKSEAEVSAAAPFQKGSLYNRYRIAAANGPLWLTVPLQGGRLQKVPVSNLCISYAERWQHRHEQTLISAYGRAPHFEALWFLIEPLFQKRYELLADFNLEALAALSRALQLRIRWHLTADLPVSAYSASLEPFPAYRQVFESRHGFQSGLSILDLLFCQGIFI